MRFVDCNGLAGFMSLGWVQQGWEMAYRAGTLDFGSVCVTSNRHLFLGEWEFTFSDDPDEWRVPDGIQAVVGLPPCSGWSVYTGGALGRINRGPQAKAHAHTRALIQYAGRVKPEAVVFECVQQAFTQGRDVMLEYRDMLELISNRRYDLYHVKHNVLQIGGFAFRERYFWVAVREGLTFGATNDWPDEIPTVMDVIGDIQNLPETWEKQPYRQPISRWASNLRSHDGTLDGHITRQNIHGTRITDIFDALGGPDEWDPRAGLGDMLRKAHEKNGELPVSWSNKAEKIVENDFYIGFSQPYRWRADRAANVLTGSALDCVIHPTQPRPITHREAARIQGLPDAWRIKPSRDYSPLPATWGKAVSAHAGAWIAGLVRDALNGSPGVFRGELIGDREWLLDCARGFSRAAVAKRYHVSKGEVDAA